LDRIENSELTKEEMEEEFGGVSVEEMVGALIAAEHRINELESECEAWEQKYNQLMTGGMG
jgi:hypothetical protein